MLSLVLVLSLVTPQASPVRISGVNFDGYLTGNPEPDSAVRLTNTDLKRPANIGGYTLTERFTPQKKRGRVSLTTTSSERGLSTRGGGGVKDDRNEGVRFPQGTIIPPGGEIWVASTAWGFRRVWGYLPDYEASPTSEAVPDMEGDGQFLKLSGSRGTLALVDDGAAVVDFVAYDTTKEIRWTADDFSDLPWRGGPLELRNTSFYGWQGQVLSRDRDSDGHLLADTDSAVDWDSGFSRKHLGEEPTHRIERAGQSRFARVQLKERAKVLATSAPDNNYQALIDAFASARKRIQVRIYQMTNPKVVDALLKAKARGVDVVIYLEGAPVGGIPDQERYLLDRCDKAGIPIYFLGGKPKERVKPRYRFDHSKYVIIDDKKVIIGTENYGRTGVPPINSFGNRGWMVHIENPTFVRQLQAVWNADLVVDEKGKGVVGDIVHIRDDATDAYGMPYRDPKFTPDEGTLLRGRYRDPVKPTLVDDVVGLELVLSPDTCLNEDSAIIGLIGRAKKQLYIEQNSVRRRWGKKGDDNDTEGEVPNLALQAVIAAARRGVAVRVLMDGTWYNVQGEEDRDNDNTALWLNALAAREGLDLVAKVINLESTGLEKIHAKGVIVDDAEVFVGSINWTENSFKGNREVGVVLSHPKIAGYYANLFRRDWARSRTFQAPVVEDGVVARAAADDSARVRFKVKKGQSVGVVGEHRRKAADGQVWLEVQVPKTDETAFIPASVIGTPSATPEEALHVVGRDAVVEGVVVATSVSERRVQLRFADEQRPPFTAVIFSKNFQAFEAAGLNPTVAFQGRKVRVKGRVKMYHEPEIIIDAPDQIELVR